MISVQGKFLCNNITEGFTFFRYNRDTKFERGTKHWQKEWQVSIKKDVLPAEYVKILVRWQLSRQILEQVAALFASGQSLPWMLCCGRRNSVCRMWKMCKVLSGRLY